MIIGVYIVIDVISEILASRHHMQRCLLRQFTHPVKVCSCELRHEKISSLGYHMLQYAPINSTKYLVIIYNTGQNIAENGSIKDDIIVILLIVGHYICFLAVRYADTYIVATVHPVGRYYVLM